MLFFFPKLILSMSLFVLGGHWFVVVLQISTIERSKSQCRQLLLVLFTKVSMAIERIIHLKNAILSFTHVVPKP